MCAKYNMFVPEGLTFFIPPSSLPILPSMIFGHEVLLVRDNIITPSDTISNNKFGVLQERLSYMYSKVFHQAVYLSHEPQPVNLREVLCLESYNDPLLFLNIIIICVYISVAVGPISSDSVSRSRC